MCPDPSTMNAQTTPKKSLGVDGTRTRRTRLSDAAARLQRALNAQTSDQPSVGDCLTRISQLEEELSSVTAEAENKRQTALRESATMASEIRDLKDSLEQLKTEVTASREAVAKCERDSKLQEQKRSFMGMKLPRAKDDSHKMTKSKEATLSAEVDSLKMVLEMKLSELVDERRKVDQLRLAVTELPAALQRAKCEKENAELIRAQLKQKLEDEEKLIQEKRLLVDSVSQLTAQKNNLTLHNEQLQYKLKHNTTVANLLNQSSSSSSISSEPLSTSPIHPTARSNSSFDSFFNEISPNSAKVMGVLKKSDSVSWIVEVEEPPEETASRIVRQAKSSRHPAQPKGKSSKSSQSPMSHWFSSSNLEPLSQARRRLSGSFSIENKMNHRRINSSTPNRSNT